MGKGILSIISLLFVVAMLAASPVMADTAVIDWTSNTETDLSGYKVYQSTVSGVYGAPVATLGLVNTATLTLPTLTIDQRYFFTITAFDLGGNESPKSLEVSKVALVSPAPQGFTVASPGASSFVITWVPVLDAAGLPVKVEFRYSKSPLTFATGTVASCTASPCTVNGLLASTGYQVQSQDWRLNSAGNKVMGALSSVVSVTTQAPDLPPTAPVGVTVQ